LFYGGVEVVNGEKALILNYQDELNKIIRSNNGQMFFELAGRQAGREEKGEEVYSDSEMMAED
jgi:hypothetical protein